MKTMVIKHDQTNDRVILGEKIMDQVLGVLENMGKTMEKVCIITDETLWPLYADLMKTSFLNSNHAILYHTIKKENSFTDQKREISKTILDRKMGENDLLILLGGKTVQATAYSAIQESDIAVPILAVPTTPSSMLDSLREKRKNRDHILIDLDVLSSLEYSDMA